MSDPGTEPTSLGSPAVASGFFTTSATWEVLGRIQRMPNDEWYPRIPHLFTTWHLEEEFSTDNEWTMK